MSPGELEEAGISSLTVDNHGNQPTAEEGIWRVPCPTIDVSCRACCILRVVMIGFVVTGVAGLVLHYRGNAEFELERVPTRAELELVWEALRGATPALAPGSMILLGLMGMLFCYQHPVLD